MNTYIHATLSHLPDAECFCGDTRVVAVEAQPVPDLFASHLVTWSTVRYLCSRCLKDEMLLRALEQ